jgi:hypothetical protein
MADVFISYKREERAQVERIAERLRGLGLSVWFDARLPSGESFDEEINRELHAAKCVLVCWSPGAVQSQWVRAEAAIGRDRDVLAAVTLAPTTLYPPFNLIHSVDLSNWDGADLHPGWLGVIGRVGALTDRPDLVERAGRYAAVSAATGDDALKRVTVEKRGPRSSGKRGWGFWAAIAAVGLAIGIGGWSAVQYFQERNQTAAYDVVFEQRVLGLREGAPVYFNGIEVGSVSRISIDAYNTSLVVARLEIADEVPVRVDSVATLETVGAAIGLNISPGSQAAGLLHYREGQPPPRIPLEGTSGASGLAPDDGVHRQGVQLISSGQSFDLDLGNLATDSAELAVVNGALVPTPSAGAWSPLDGAELAERERCGLERAAAVDGEVLARQDDALCINTDAGRRALVVLVAAPVDPAAPYEFRYIVWNATR